MKKLKNVNFFLALVLLLIAIFYGFKTSNSNFNVQNDSELKVAISVNDSSESIEKKINDINKNIIKKNKINDEMVLRELREKEYIFGVFGTDERGDEISRSDIIIIVKYTPKEDGMYILSIPRDTKVEIPGRYEDKINHSYAFGGIGLITLTLEDFLDIKIDYYIKLNFENFKEIIDLVGGVEVSAVKDYKYPGYIDINKGKQVLNGEKALDYVRFRYDENGDYGRINRQHEILMELINRMQKKVNEESDDMTEKFYSKVKTNLSLDAFLNFKKLINASDEIKFEDETLKTSGQIINGIWYEIYDLNHLKSIKEKLIID